jgi:hypothetical protein
LRRHAVGRIAQQSNPSCREQDLRQDLQPLRVELGGEDAEPGGVPPGLAKLAIRARNPAWRSPSETHGGDMALRGSIKDNVLYLAGKK